VSASWRLFHLEEVAMKRLVLAVSFAVFSTGCATTFFGEANIKGGTEGCRTICQQWGMELAGMVQMGEYSNGCICQVKPQEGQSQPSAVNAASGVAPAISGVMMQMQRSQQQPARAR
jgi:hypothetical protein